MSKPVLDELRQIAGTEENNIPVKAMLRLVIAGLVEITDTAEATNSKLEQANEKLHTATDGLIEAQKNMEIVKKNCAEIEMLKSNPFVRLGWLINRYPKRTFVVSFLVVLLLMFLPTLVVGIAQILGVPLELVQFVFRIPPSIIP